MRSSKVSPRRVGLQGPSDGISPVVEEEVISTGEDDVFDGKTEAPENTEQSEKQGTDNLGIHHTHFLFHFCDLCHWTAIDATITSSFKK